VIGELEGLIDRFVTPDGNAARVVEVVLVHDHGPDDSARVMRELASKHDWVRTVWLSRTYGQHAATLAGMSSSDGDWIVTVDEDGQQIQATSRRRSTQRCRSRCVTDSRRCSTTRR
jgi:undecaprenyl-phosphate 4-deoxy-4-formamido-L-arabinose transferase